MIFFSELKIAKKYSSIRMCERILEKFVKQKRKKRRLIEAA